MFQLFRGRNWLGHLGKCLFLRSRTCCDVKRVKCSRLSVTPDVSLFSVLIQFCCLSYCCSLLCHGCCLCFSMPELLELNCPPGTNKVVRTELFTVDYILFTLMRRLSSNVRGSSTQIWLIDTIWNLYDYICTFRFRPQREASWNSWRCC